ncbi:2-oxo-4-hydroxy-4-carboxy-5-ureidoimidazoline decarboxylase [Tropicimonas sp. S265A]|uniref:2-oxo-4-hydroxy-4-carboxy-5-ureidoimidazoline decarboxylase n=1 Tax=Tropicimonas sp. S265A TaxID=3415134 RepID=UPI003C7E8418
MPEPAPLAFSIAALNKATASQAAAMIDRIVERSAWLAHRAAAARPFGGGDDLAAWLEAEIHSLSRDKAVEFLCAHPELSPPDPATITAASRREQQRLRLLDPDPDLADRLSDLNRRYVRRHGYPFVIALHAHKDIEDVLTQFEQRLGTDHDEELTRSLKEVVSVMRARLARLIDLSTDARDPAAPLTERGGVQ